MHVHIAECSDKTFRGNVVDCFNWAKEQVRQNPSAVVSIYRFRTGEKTGRVIGQITSDGIMRSAFPISVNQKSYKNGAQKKNPV